MTNSQHLVRRRQENKLDETDRMAGVKMRDWKDGGRGGEGAKGGAMRRKQRGREAGRDGSSTGSQQPSF